LRVSKLRGASSDVTSQWTVTQDEDLQWFDDAGGRNTAEWSSLVSRLGG